MKKAFNLIHTEKVNFPVAVMARVLKVNRTAYYNWARRPPSKRELEDRHLTRLVKEIHAANRGVYGSPRIHAELRMAHGIKVSRKRVERLMVEARISGLVPKRRGKTTIRVPGVRVASDLLLRDFTATAPDQIWAADITYLRTWEGWVYLAVVQDLYSRRIVGWSMADHMRSELVVDALKMAVHRRQPEKGLTFHSDQGSQFVSLAFGQFARANGISQSMGQVGSAYDNSVAETFFATLKKELIYRRSWQTRNEVRTEVFEYIEGFY
ncbi:MAG: IS3 family transposase, partial [Solirubrobacterales bacterium]